MTDVAGSSPAPSLSLPPARHPSGAPSPRARDRARRCAAVTTAVVVMAVGVGCLLWSRRTDPPPSVVESHAIGTPLTEQIVGFWKGVDGAVPDAVVFRPDGSVVPVVGADQLLSPARSDGGTYRVDGDTLVVSHGVLTRAGCDGTFTVRRLAEGWIRLTQMPSGPCTPTDLLPPFTLLRLSPVSRGGLAHPGPPPSSSEPVVTTNPLHGAWVLQGSGLVLVVGRTAAPPPVSFRLDAGGTVDTAPQDQGDLTVTTPGRVVLHSDTSPTTPSCGDTVLGAVEAGSYAFTAQVLADPCHHFAGQATLSWTLVE